MMHSLNRLFFLLFSLLLAAQAALAESRGLLWEISAPGQPTSYLFGTIHSEDERVLALPSEVAAALHDSPRFAMEIVPDSTMVAQMIQRMRLPGGQRLATLLGPGLHAQMVQTVGQYGLPAEAAEQLKPWALVMILSMPKPRTGQILDLVLHDMAVRQGKTVVGLETVDEQIEALDGLSMAMQIELLRHTLEQYQENDAFIEALTHAWLLRDLDALQHLGEASNATMPDELELAVQARLVDERNTRMVQRVIPLLQQGGVFVAVGALHLPGKRGLIAQLRARGFTVRPLY